MTSTATPPAGSSTWSFRRRIVVTTAVTVAALVAVVGVLLHVVLDATAGHDVEQVLASRGEAAVTVIETASRGRPSLTVPQAALDPGTQVYDSAGTPIAGSLSARVERSAAELVADGGDSTGAGDDVRLRALPILTDTGVRGTVVVSQDTDPYERSETYVTLAIVVLGLLTTAVAAVVAGRVARQALSPVSVMAERAADWSSHDLSHRFDLGPPTDELTTLGATLDQLLDRVAMAIRSEQRLTAELAHELRTPLAGIRGSADLALLRAQRIGLDDDLRADLEAISSSATAMGEVISTLLDLARAPGGGSTGCTLAEVAERLTVPSTEPGGVEVHLELPGERRVAGPADVVAAALMPLVENAVRHARRRVTVTVAPGGPTGTVVVRVGDDGAGIAPDMRARIFEPGISGTDGTGLGLAIAQRAARSIGGEIGVGESEQDGATVLELRLPPLPG